VPKKSSVRLNFWPEHGEAASDPDAPRGNSILAGIARSRGRYEGSRGFADGRAPRSHDMSPPPFDEQLKKVIADLVVPMAGALVTYAQDAAGDLITLRCEFMRARPDAVRQNVDYGVLLLGEAWLPLVDALRLLTELARGLLRLNDQPVDTFAGPSYLVERQIGTGRGLTAWPEWTFELSRANGPRALRYLAYPLATVGQRPFKSAALAIATWVWRVDSSWSGSYPPHNGEAVVAVPDLRARVATVEWEEERFSVRTEFFVERSQLQVQALIRDIGEFHVLPQSAPSDDGTVQWPIPKTASGAEVYLVHAVDGLLWNGDFTNTGGRTRPVAPRSTPVEIAEVDLREGESDRVEFKPFLVLGKDHQKRQEVVKTVVAFANSAGGRLYLGVEDDATLQGSAQLMSAVGMPPDKAEKAMMDHVDRLIRNQVKPTPAFSKHFVSIAESPVLIVNVERGRERPYATHENEIWIRKGATNRRPDARTELPSLFPSSATRSRPRSSPDEEDPRSIVALHGLLPNEVD